MMNKTILSPRSKGDKIGFVDKNGIWKIDPQYDEVDVFREGVCWVKTENKWGLIDRDGNYLISPQYQGAREFNDGLANVKIGSKWGIVDKKGNLIIGPLFDYIDSFKNGAAYVKDNGKYGFVFLNDPHLIPPVYEDVRGFYEGLAAVKTEGKWGYIDTNGNMIIEPQYDYAGKFRNGKAFVGIGASGGAIDKNGEVIEKFEERDYDEKWSYEDEPWYDRGKRTLHGFIDKKGDFIIKPKFRDASTFDKNGFAVVKIDRKWGIIDLTGAYVVEPKYNYLILQDEGVYEARLGDKDFFIDIDENHVEPPTFHFNPFKENDNPDFEITIKDEKYGAKDKEGKIIINPKYDYLWYDGKEEIFLFRKGRKWGIIDRHGKIVMPPKYEILRFQEGLAPVEVKGKWGYINKKGETVINPRFDRAEEFEDGYAHIMLNHKYGIIDRSGNYIVKPLFSNLGKRFQNGYLRVAIPDREGSYSERWGVMDENGKYAVPPVYEYVVASVKEDMARIMKGERFGFADCKEDRVIEPIFDYVWDFSKGLAHVRLTEEQIEKGILDEKRYGEGEKKNLSFWQKKYDDCEEKPKKKAIDEKIAPIGDLFAGFNEDSEDIEEDLPF